MPNWQYGLLFDDAHAFLEWLKTVPYKAKITGTHVHHTYSPDHSKFKGNNHKALQDSMRNYHVRIRKWRDIGQHVTVFPDGKVMTGRNIDLYPASASGYNGDDSAHPFMLEMIGNFDIGHDRLEGKQLESAIVLCRHFGNVMFHREGLINGKEPKSCPGTSIDKKWFMDLVNRKDDRMNPEDANKIIRFLSAAWFIVEGNKEAENEFHRLANELRKVSGQKVE